MGMDASRLALTLADRLAAIAPDGFSITARDGTLWYADEPGSFPWQTGDYQITQASINVRDALGLHGTAVGEQLAGLAVQALDVLQDFVSESTGDPWPGTRAQPEPRATMHGQSLRLWYGGPDPETDAVLACEPVPLAGLVRVT